MQVLDINKLPKPWTVRQFKFVLEYLADPKHQGTDAAIKAGFAESSAHVHAHRMLSQDKYSHIQSYIAERLQKSVDELEITVGKTLRHQAAMAYSNIGDYLKFDPMGRAYMDLSQATRDQLAAVSSIEIIELPPIGDGEGGIAREVIKTKIKLWDKNKAGETLMKHQKLIGGEEVTVNINQLDQLIAQLEQNLKAKGVNIDAAEPPPKGKKK